MSKNEVFFYIEDRDNLNYAPKIIRNFVDGPIERYDYKTRKFVEDDDMLKIFIGELDASRVSEKEALEAIEKYTKEFYL